MKHPEEPRARDHDERLEAARRSGSTIQWLETGESRRLLDPHRRAIVGASRHAQLRIQGKGVARRHLKISAHPDGRLYVFPIQGASYRVDGVRHNKPRLVRAGATLGVGLHEISTGESVKSFADDFRLAWENSQDELRELRDHLPWLALSILVHLLIFLLTLREAPVIPDGNGDGTIAVDMAQDGNDEDAEDEADREEREAYPEIEAPVAELETPVETGGSAFEGEGLASAASGDGAAGFADDLDARTRAALTQRLRTRNEGDDDAAQGSGRGPAPPIPQNASPKFKKTVAGLRRSGLEIVFCFDSTGSMEPVLSDAKSDLLEIFELVQELVPRSRMGIITYRDRGDDYVTRATRLGIGRYEALAFLSSVRADGGGDFPEAVDAALKLASRFPWRSSARKITIVVGDAPPHPDNMRKALATARKMGRRNGQVHVLLTGNERHAEPLGRIAHAGGGRILPRRQRDQLALQLLTFALGPDSDTDLRKLLEQRRHRAELRARERTSATIPDVRILAGTLQRDVPDAVVVEAWTWARGRVLRELPKALADRRLGKEGVLALYYLVNRLLERHGQYERVEPPKLPTPRTGIPRELKLALRKLRGREARRNG